MKYIRKALAVLVCFVCPLLTSIVANATLIQADNVTTDMGAFSASFNVNNLISQNGLSTSYNSGVTDFDVYVPVTTHNSIFDEWQSTAGVTTGTVTFDFGSTVSIDAFALWNSSWSTGGAPIDVNQFELLVDNDTNFGNGVLASLGLFNAVSTDGPHPSQVFTFSPASLQFLHMNLQANHGGAASGFAGIVFRSSPTPAPVPIPEPGTIAFFGLGLAGFGVIRKKMG